MISCYVTLLAEDIADFVKNNLEKFEYSNNECKLSDIFMSEPKRQLKIVEFDPFEGLFLFDIENLLLIRLKQRKRSQTRPIKCSFNEGDLKLNLCILFIYLDYIH